MLKYFRSAAPPFFGHQPTRGEPVDLKMHWSSEMTTQTSGIRPLTDTEIDDVNGGSLFLAAIAGVVAVVGLIQSYYGANTGGGGDFSGGGDGGIVPGL
jgi:hypothetical protein